MDVPLGGLIGTASLDAIVTCELEVDKSTLASVVSRADLLPFTGRQNGSGGLGSKLGKITARLTLICDSCPDKEQNYCGKSEDFRSADRANATRCNLKGLVRGEVKEIPIQGTAYNLMPKPQPLFTPLHISGENVISLAVVTSTQSVDGIVPGEEEGEEDLLHAAMMFVPSEGYRDKPRSNLTFPRAASSVQPTAVRATMGIVVKGLLGIDVGALHPETCLVKHCPHKLKDRETPVLLSRITVAYKPSQLEKEEIHGPWILTSTAKISEHGDSYQVKNPTTQSISDGFVFHFYGVTMPLFLYFQPHALLNTNV